MGSKEVKRKLRNTTIIDFFKKKLPVLDLPQLSDSLNFPPSPKQLEFIIISDDEEAEPRISSTRMADSRKIDFNKKSISSTSRNQFTYPGPKDSFPEELGELSVNLDQSLLKPSGIIRKRTYKKTQSKKISEEDVMAYVDSITDINKDELKRQIEERNALLYPINDPTSPLPNEIFDASVPDILIDCNIDFLEEVTHSSKDLPKNNKNSGLQQECPVCFEPLSGDISVMATQCGHVYCGDCMKTILNTTKQCPTCRSVLNNNKVFPIFIFN